MKLTIALTIALFVPTSALALPAQDAGSAAGSQTTWPALPEIGDTSRMDPEVVALVQTHQAAVRAAQEQAEGEEGRRAVGMAYTELGLAFEANTMWTPARDCYQNAYDLIPGEGSHRDQWLYRVGVCEYALGYADKAVEVLAEVAPRLSGTAVVHAKLAVAYTDLGRLEEAAASWRDAIQAEQIAWEKADPELRPAKPVPLAASRVGLAQAEWELDHLDQAEALLLEALRLQEYYPHAHYLLGQIYAEQGKLEEAEFQLTRGRGAYPVMPPDPHGPQLAAKRAGYGNRMRNIEIAMQEGRLPEALAELEAMMVERPDDIMVLNLAARGQMMQGRIDKSLELLTRSETIDPTQYQTKNQLALTYINLVGQSQNAEQHAERLNLAKTKAQEALELAPHLGSPWFYRGLAELAGFNPQDPNGQQIIQNVMNMFQRAHLLGCQEPQLYEQMTQLYAQTGRTREMVEFAKQGAQKNPENPGSWALLARAYLTVGEKEEAMRAGERALAVGRGNPQIQDFVNQLRQAIQQSGQ